MRRVAGSFGLLIAISVALSAALLAGPEHRAHEAFASGTGGTISIGAPSLLNGQIVVPINTTATTDPYSGFNIHLRFDGAVLSASPPTFVSGGALETSGGLVQCFAVVT